MLISIVIPSKNSQSTLLECLKSIIAQAFDRIEVIVVLDQTSDFSIDIAESTLGASGLFYKIIEVDYGSPALARNHGLYLSSGSYIHFLDADDILPNHAIAAFIGCLDQKLNLSKSSVGYHSPDDIQHIAVGPTCSFWNDDELECLIQANLIYPQIVCDVENANPLDFYLRQEVLGSSFKLSLGSYLFPRELLVRKGGFCKVLRCNDDTEFILRILSDPLVSLVATSRPVYYYRRLLSSNTVSAVADRSKLNECLQAFSQSQAIVPVTSSKLSYAFYLKWLSAIANYSASNGEYSIYQGCVNILNDLFGERAKFLCSRSRLAALQEFIGFYTACRIYSIYSKLRCRFGMVKTELL